MNGAHTCDKRSKLNEVKSDYPVFDFDPGMTEEDELWDPKVRETAEEVKERVRGLVERIFETDKGKCEQFATFGFGKKFFLMMIAS